MSCTAELKLVRLVRDGVALAHLEAGPEVPAAPPLVFIHGWMGDHRALLPQISYFARRRHVVAINLRGHGDSDAPQQDYTIDGFADDVAWQCNQLGLSRPLIIGHSLGGMIALELAGRHPDLPSGVVMIDTIIFPPPQAAELARQLAEQISGSDYFGAARKSALDMFMDYVDLADPARKDRLMDEICAAHRKTAQHVAVSTFLNMLSGYEFVSGSPGVHGTHRLSLRRGTAGRNGPRSGSAAGPSARNSSSRRRWARGISRHSRCRTRSTP